MANRKITAARVMAEVLKCEQKANVAGYIVLKGEQHIGTVRISYPRDGAGKLKVLVADWTFQRPKGPDGLADFTNSTPWQYGWANGGGYDKATAAMDGMSIAGCVLEDQGHGWAHQLHNAGFTVMQAV